MAKIKHNVSVKASLSKVYDAITKIKELQNW